MAYQFEFEDSHEFIPPLDLWKKSVVENLIKQGRTPFLMRQEEDTKTERVTCFIPQSESKPPRAYDISLETARRIVSIRDELRRLS